MLNLVVCPRAIRLRDQASNHQGYRVHCRLSVLQCSQAVNQQVFPLIVLLAFRLYSHLLIRLLNQAVVRRFVLHHLQLLSRRCNHLRNRHRLLHCSRRLNHPAFLALCLPRSPAVLRRTSPLFNRQLFRLLILLDNLLQFLLPLLPINRVRFLPLLHRGNPTVFHHASPKVYRL